MPIQDLNQNIFLNVFSYLDIYDANNLSMVNKFFQNEVKANRFHNPIYRKFKNGFSIIETHTFKYKSLGFQESLTWCEIRGNRLVPRNRYIIYMNDDFGGNPYFFEKLSEVESIMNSYYTFKEGYTNQKKFLENKKKKEITPIKKGTFLIKDINGGKITNPWNKIIKT